MRRRATRRGFAGGWIGWVGLTPRRSGREAREARHVHVHVHVHMHVGAGSMHVGARTCSHAYLGPAYAYGGWCLDGYLDGYALKWAPLEPQRHRVSVLGIEHRPKTSVRCKGACMQLRVVQNAQDFDLCPRSVH